MLKINTLRDAMTHDCTWCHANPEKFTVYVNTGGIETTGESPSFLYRYTIGIFVMDFTQSVDELMVPLMRWLYRNQPDLLLNPEKTGISNFPLPSMTTTVPISCWKSRYGSG